MRIYIGNYNIASQLDDWRYGFEKNGCHVTVGCYKSNLTPKEPFIELSRYYKYKILGNRSKFLHKAINYGLSQALEDPRKKIWEKTLTEHDVFFYIWRGFFEDLRDFKDIKDAGKTLIVSLLGGDTRWYPAYNQDVSKNGLPQLNVKDRLFDIDALKQKLRYIRFIEKYADAIYGDPTTTSLFFRNYGSYIQPIILPDFQERSNQRKKPLIVHIPSDPYFKGSEDVHKALNTLLDKKVPFDYFLPQNRLKYEDAKKIYLKSDVVVGQLKVPGGGKQERELLANGKIVMSLMAPNYMSHIPKDCPIIDVNSNNISEKLENVILDFEFRKNHALKGRPYIEKHHDTVKICKQILDDLETGYSRYVYKPRFFREEFIPESNHFAQIYNKFTNIISKEGWYLKSVKPGERVGLIF